MNIFEEVFQVDFCVNVVMGCIFTLMLIVLFFVQAKYLFDTIIDRDSSAYDFFLQLIMLMLTVSLPFVFEKAGMFTCSSLINSSLINSSLRYEVSGLDGKLAYSIPDTMNMYEPEKVLIRISKETVNDTIYLSNFKFYNEILIEKIPISSIMKVELSESNFMGKMEIKRINNHAEQLIDTTDFSEWTFEITPIGFGEIELILSVSMLNSVELFGKYYYDIPVYEKKIVILASQTQIVKFFFKEKRLSIPMILCIIMLVMVFFKATNLIIYMTEEKKTDFWNAGSLGLVIYLITFMSILVFKIFDITLWYVPLVFIGTLLLYVIFTAVTLRDNDKISEENFINLMGIVISKIPPLNWILKRK